MREYKYWMVHNPNNRQPYKVYGNDIEAMEEAKRLAKKHIGEKFFLLEATGCYSVSPPEPNFVKTEFATNEAK